MRARGHGITFFSTQPSARGTGINACPVQEEGTEKHCMHHLYRKNYYEEYEELLKENFKIHYQNNKENYKEKTIEYSLKHKERQ